MYAWVSEGSVRKYHRAIAELKKTNQEITEEAIKTLYVRDGGLVIGDDSTIKGTPEVEPVPEPEELTVEAETKRGRSRKTE